HQFARLGPSGEGVRVVRIIRAAGPKRVLVQLQMLALDAAEDHRAQPAVADGQSLRPFHGGVGVKQRERRRSFRRVTGLQNEKRREGGKKIAGQCWHGEILASTAPHSSSNSTHGTLGRGGQTCDCTETVAGFKPSAVAVSFISPASLVGCTMI